MLVASARSGRMGITTGQKRQAGQWSHTPMIRMKHAEMSESSGHADRPHQTRSGHDIDRAPAHGHASDVHKHAPAGIGNRGCGAVWRNLANLVGAVLSHVEVARTIEC